MVVLNIFHVLIAIAMVALVLVQRGAGATAGAAFGSGASGTVFGSRGAGTFLTKSTWVLATLFCAISLTIAVLVSRVDVRPEADLGVVAGSVPAAVEQDVETIVIGPDGAAVSVEQVDMPVLQVSEEDGNGGVIMQEQAVDDLPGLDGTVIESTESGQAEQAAGTDSDDS